MKKGTKSILFGVHQFLWHPLTVFLAWIWLFRSLPTWREAVCIVIHDWGYWGKANMDDEEGEKHPELGADIAHKLLDERVVQYGFECPGGRLISFRSRTLKENTFHDLCLYHSRHYARNAGVEPSKLCWADKLSIMFEPWWLYLPRAWASGELSEYRAIAAGTGFISLSASNREWFAWLQKRLVKLGKEKRGDVVTYTNPLRSAAAKNDE